MPDQYDEYIEFEECVNFGAHLTSCDDDGYCNFCGYQDLPDDDDNETPTEKDN